MCNVTMKVMIKTSPENNKLLTRVFPLLIPGLETGRFFFEGGGSFWSSNTFRVVYPLDVAAMPSNRSPFWNSIFIHEKTCFSLSVGFSN